MKLKKVLFVLGIVGFGLFNFSNAGWIGYGVVGDFFTNVNNNSIDLKIDNLLNFSSSIGNIDREFFTIYSDSSIINIFYWNTDNILSFYSSNGLLDFYPGAPNDSVGGTLSEFYLCDGIDGNFSQFSNCVKYDYTGVSISFLSELLGYVSLSDNIYYGDSKDCSTCRPDRGWTAPFIGINISSYGKSLVFIVQPDSGSRLYGLNNIGNYYGFGYNIDYSGSNYNYDFETFPDDLIGDSPSFNGGGDSDSPDYPPVEYISTYGQFFINKGDAYQLYETLGYSKGICYGNFATGSLVESGFYNYFLSYLLPTECDDSEDYCGGSFFDFYNTQSGLSLQSYFNRFYYTSKSIFEHPDNISLLSALVGYPKGMWYIMYKIFYFYDNLYIPFSSVDYLAYCDMAVNGFDPSDTFDVSHSLAFENFIQEVMDAYLGQDIDYGSGDDVGTGMVAVSLNSSTGSLSEWFSRLKFAVLNNRFVFSDRVGVLPTYIGVAFILMLLYYGFKR